MRGNGEFVYLPVINQKHIVMKIKFSKSEIRNALRNELNFNSKGAFYQVFYVPYCSNGEGKALYKVARIDTNIPESEVINQVSDNEIDKVIKKLPVPVLINLATKALGWDIEC